MHASFVHRLVAGNEQGDADIRPPMRRVAVVGSGVAGLTAAWVLRTQAEVTIYEADDRLGGHAHSHIVARPDGGRDVVDTGFIVMNYATYPTLGRLFAELGVATQPAAISMSVSCEECSLEYAGAKGLTGLFASEAARRSPQYWGMLFQINRFHRAARAVLRGRHDDEASLGQFLARNQFSDYFVNHFAIPLVACVWSCPPGIATDYPARYLFSFLDNHGMLRIWGSSTWHTVVGGSREYVSRIAAVVSDVRLGTAVTQVARYADRVVVTSEDGVAEVYDAAVIATHPDQALAIVAGATPLERDVLGAFEYSPNLVELHSDESLLPASGRARASWNFRAKSCQGSSAVGGASVTYDMNRLQRLGGPMRYLVSLNAEPGPDRKTVLEQMRYAHPRYTPRSVAAQRRLPQLNSGRLAFAGAYHGWGFHEDGARSGVNAARALGARW